ncbi:hypothetical protein M434DRAFT_35086 [Hypoxylon sp. CO27-5]|nr:hypothetical protein M434DRAFT_35086 [Hypoxylon sp. CO27-5]
MHLAMIGLLGPDFLFGIALGQLSSAHRSVKLFKRDKHLCNGTKWTYRHAFFVDMGGIFLTSIDFPDGLPITGEQLHYLVKYGHVDFPDMDAMAIDERNTTDTLSRLITVWQVFWFAVTELQRVKLGLPMTTLELTSLSFVLVMIATSVCWFRKPSISYPRMIPTKDGKSMDDIRVAAKQLSLKTHPDLDETWYRTPVDFISGHRWRIEAHWAYYTSVLHIFHLNVVSRTITSRPWNRFPSDMWLPPDMIFVPFGIVVLLLFSSSFLVAWNFFFPTYIEKLLWRIFGLYHAIFVVYGGIYYLIEAIKWNKRMDKHSRSLDHLPLARSIPLVAYVSRDADLETQPSQPPKRTLIHAILRWFFKKGLFVASWRNISVDQDPEMAVPLRVIVPVTVTCIIYIICRLFIYVEDFLSLRTQPAGVYVTVNRFIPFLGDG